MTNLQGATDRNGRRLPYVCSNCQNGYHDAPHTPAGPARNATWACECACNPLRPRAGFYIVSGDMWAHVTTQAGRVLSETYGAPRDATAFFDRVTAQVVAEALMALPRATHKVVREIGDEVAIEVAVGEVSA